MDGHSPGEEPTEVAALFRAHGRYVWRSLVYLGVPEREVPDLVQEVFVVVHRKLDGFDGRSSLRTWLYGIAVRVALANRRSARVRLEEVTDAPPERHIEAPQERDVDRARQRRWLQAAVARLPPNLRVVFVLFEIEGVPIKEIAATQEVPLKTAYSRLYKAREEVRRHFNRTQLTGDAA